MKSPNIMKIYELWLHGTGVNHNYTERMGALAILLWLKDKGFLQTKTDKN
jgi:hypothetical protein